jgi:glycosyltransferase involved in cell wall biosynthesis
MCSTVEGLGSSALEAIAAGVPTVLTAGGGLTDVAGEIPVIPPADHQALADSLTRLIADPVARAERRAAGLARARSFTAARMVERTLQCYEVLATRPAESVH